MTNIAIIILAAGSSKRLGSPKQLLRFQSKSLLQRIVEQVLEIKATNYTIVIGAKKELMYQELLPYPINIVENSVSEQGLATSIKAGLLAAARLQQHLDGCLFVVCDQPFLDAAILQRIVDLSQQTSKGIIAAAYAGSIGTPMLFHKKYFPELLLLQGDEGAKKIVIRYPNDLETVSFPAGAIDIDTAEDYKNLTDPNR